MPSPLPIAGHQGFDCTRCGECCRGDQVVRLNGGDLARLCAYTGLPDLDALVAGGLVELVHEDPGVLRPRLRFRRRPFAFCPFLANGLDEEGRVQGLCQLHPHHKPLVCQLAPLAREVVDDGVAWTESFSMVAPVDGCPGMGRGEPPGLPEGELRRRLDEELAWMRALLAEGGPNRSQ